VKAIIENNRLWFFIWFVVWMEADLNVGLQVITPNMTNSNSYVTNDRKDHLYCRLVMSPYVCRYAKTQNSPSWAGSRTSHSVENLSPSTSAMSQLNSSPQSAPSSQSLCWFEN